MTGKGRVWAIVGIIVLVAVVVAAWVIIRPGPLAWVDGKRVPLAQYTGGKITGVPADFESTDPIARGKYLTEAADCEACHTVEGGQPFAGGRPFDTEYGTLYSPNITPDEETGIGTWTDADFLRAVHEGIGKDGKYLYPAFPYNSYTYLHDEDVLAIKAYLFSLPPVKNKAPENTLRAPYNNRSLMKVWGALYNPKERFQPVADKSASWNRGAYLAEALGHCGDCHTPRTALQALDNRRKYAGGMAEGWRAYNLSSDKESGIGNWSAEDMIGYLRTGHTQNRGSAFGPMAQAVHLSFQKLTPSDVAAIVEYVRSVPPVSTPDLPAPKLEPAPDHPSVKVAADEQHPKGQAIYASMCAGCHAWTGVNDFVPHATLTGTRAVNDPTATNVALAVLRGASTLPASGDIAVMPAFGDAWTDDEIAAVSNYVVARFGAKPSSITAAEVAKLRAMR
ncbi:MAG TPA: cytochrome c [Steroidobacteraceae bacterium]|jgi:mono/diheme cytochrome c family protein|nr:cytochrome c [Steroidobacteraceae bacterium]